jgi:glycosyltransferase involved in cell wall biosynthesis
VVPSFNRAESLSGTIESLLAQDPSLPYEIIVVDNNSSDATRSVVETFGEKARGRLRYVFEGDQGLSVARNAGIAAAKGEIVAFVDDDAVASPNWLENLAATYRTHPDAWCVGGKIVLNPSVTLPSWFGPASKLLLGFLSHLDLGDDTIRLEYPCEVWGANFSVRREALSRVGFFDAGLGWSGKDRHLAGDESELCLRIHRAGGAIYYCGQAKVTHVIEPARLRKPYFRRRAYWQGRTRAILLPQDPRRPLWRKLASLGITTMRKCGGVLYHYSFGDACGGFERELAVLSLLGNLEQTFLMAWTPRNGRAGSQ